jgi:uncharacterized membrane-anchored protein
MFMFMAILLVIVVAYLGQDLEIDPDGGFFDHMNLALMTIAAFIFSILSLITGILALIRDKETSVLCYLSLVLAAIAIYFGVSEFIGEMNVLNPQTKKSEPSSGNEYTEIFLRSLRAPLF